MKMENRLEIYTTPLNFWFFARSEPGVLDAPSLTRAFNPDLNQSIYHIISFSKHIGKPFILVLRGRI
ncbi:hypothetical protein BH18THE1_BH18THE1_13420 [soil metagenome]